MANLTGINTDMSGKVGQFVYRKTKRGVVVAQAPGKPAVPRRSEKQAILRCQLGNQAANFRLYGDKLALAFEDKAAGQSEFNLFVQVNYGVNPVYITKQDRLNGACVVAGYTFCRGTLTNIGHSINSSGVLVSSLALGTLSIGATTTVADLAAAIIANNTGWEDLDQITFFRAIQYRDAEYNIPRALMDSWRLVLDLADETLLYNRVPSLGFTTVNGYLGMSQALSDGGAAWVHSRDRGNGNIRVGTQHLVVVNPLLEAYQSTAAMRASADSYGGINSKAVYLSPNATLTSIGSQTAYAGGGTQQSTGGSGSGTQSGGSSSGTGSGTGSGSGSGTGGSSETPTVVAPTISGTTPFEESTTVTMSGPAGSTIHYTTDGSTPTASSTQYSEALTLTDTTTVKAVAVKDGVSSSVTTRTFTKGSGGGGSENPETE